MHDRRPPRERLLVLAAFGAIYFIWGSTFLAIRYAVEALPPLALMGLRSVAAGLLLLGGARLASGAGAFAWPTRAQWGHAAVAGVFLFGGSHGVLATAERHVPSGVAALAMATIPLWLVLLDALRPGGARPSGRVLLGMLVGVAGVGLLAGDGAASASVGGLLLLVGSALSWAVGSLYARHAPRAASAPVHTGAQLLAGGVVLLAGSAAFGEHGLRAVAVAPPRALAAFAFLIVLGSVVTFTAYTWLLRVSTPARVGTYAFVNPVVAVLLGWAIAGEALTGRLLAALVVVLAGVGLVITAPKPAAAPVAAPADDEVPLAPRPARAAAS